jgi:hypothetical protein
MGSGKVFIIRGRSLMYIMKRMGPRNDPWHTPRSIITLFEKGILSVIK